MEAPTRLLLVEDSPEDALVLLKTLDRAGLVYSVTQVADEPSLIAALGSSWDLVITDYLMPGLRGDRVLELVLGRWPGVPVLVVSGRAGEELAVEVMRQGACDYILKDNLARVPFAVGRALKETRVRQARLRAEAQVARLGRMYRLLSETNQAIVRVDEPRALLFEICRLARRLGPFDLVRVTRKEGTQVEVLTEAGDGAFPLLDQEARVLAGGGAWVSADQTVALFPLRVGAEVWGCLGFHSRSAVFPPGEVSLLQELAEDLGFGLQARDQEVKRRETEQFLSDMANLVPGMFYKLRWGSQGLTFEYVSPGIDLLLPLSPSQVVADSSVVFGCLHPEDRRQFQDVATRSRDFLTVFNLEFRLLRPNGSVVWVLATAFPQKQADGVVWTGLAIDVTPQNKLQQALQREQELLAVVLNNIGEGIVAVDEAGTLALVNRTAYRLLDVPGGLGTQAPWTALDPDLPWDVEGRFRPWFRRRSDGSLVHLEALVTPLLDPDQSFRGRVLVLRDMTERDRIEERLRQSEKLESIGLLAGGIAHDFNNLLTGFFGFIQLARMNAGEPDKVIMYLDHAVGPFQRARSLTQQLLTFAKGGEPVRRPLVLSEVLVDVLRFSLGGSAVTWDLKVAPGTSRILANESQVHQVYENLFLNAKQALGEAGGALSVTLRNVPHPGPEGRGLEPRAYVESVVEDNGPGIPSEVLPKVFDPFFTTKASGTGLGLSICFSLVKNHGGAIEAESMPGQGTRFRLFWPAEVTRSPEA